MTCRVREQKTERHVCVEKSRSFEHRACSELGADALVEGLSQACKFAGKKIGVGFLVDQSRVSQRSLADDDAKIYQARVYCKSFYGEEDVCIRVGLDVKEFDRLFPALQSRRLIHAYSDSAPCQADIRCVRTPPKPQGVKKGRRGFRCQESHVQVGMRTAGKRMGVEPLGVYCGCARPARGHWAYGQKDAKLPSPGERGRGEAGTRHRAAERERVFSRIAGFVALLVLTLGKAGTGQFNENPVRWSLFRQKSPPTLHISSLASTCPPGALEVQPKAIRMTAGCRMLG